MPEEGRRTLPSHGIQQAFDVHALHQGERRSELSDIVYLNLSGRISFEYKAANEPRQHKDGEGGARARREQGANTRVLTTVEIKLHGVNRTEFGS